MKKSLYEVLGVHEQATADQIKRAYRRLARKLHPDVNPGETAGEAMSTVNEAYRVLGDQGLRASYDASRSHRLADAPSVDINWTGGIFVRPHVSITDLPSPVEAVEFVGGRKEVAIAGFDNVVRFCSSSTGRAHAELKLDGGVASNLQWCGASGLFVAGASEKSVAAWRVRSREVVESFRKRVEWASRVAVSPAGNVLALGTAYRTVLMLRPNGDTMYVRRRHEDAVTALAISTDGTVLASGGNDQRVILWDVESGKERAVLDQRAAIANLAFSRDGAMLAVALVDHGVRVFELATGAIRTTLWGHDKPVEEVAFHPSSDFAATASRDGTVGLWSLVDGSLKHRLGKQQAAVKCVRFSPDGGQLACGGAGRRVDVYRVLAG